VNVRRLIRSSVAILLGFAAALLVACGGSGKGLIPLADAGPLRSDFEAIARAAQTGNENCSATEKAIAKAESDFQALPQTVDRGLREKLSEGLANLRIRALEECEQPIAQTMTTGAQSPTTQTTQTTTSSTLSTQTSTPETQSTPTTETTTTATAPPPPGGGTQAPGESSPPAAGEQGEAGAPPSSPSVGGSSGGTGQGAGQ
jgi:hypothetical protein